MPSDGVYYIYTHLYLQGRSVKYMYPYIRVNGNRVLYITSYHYHGESKSKHGGLLLQLKKGDSVDIYGGGSLHYMGSTYSDFGIYKID